MTDAPTTIMITLNGRPRRVVSPTTVAQLLETVGVPRSAVAVELNERIVPRDAHERTPVGPGDVVEVVSFVGGG